MTDPTNSQLGLDDLVDRRNRRRAKATMPGHHKGRRPPNADQHLPNEVLSPLELHDLFEKTPADSTTNLRTRAYMATLWRTGMEAGEALALRLNDLSLKRGAESVSVRKPSGRLERRTLALDPFVVAALKAWLDARGDLPDDVVFCVFTGPTAGRAWAYADTTKVLRKVGRAAINRRLNAGAFRYTLAAELITEQWPLPHIQTQLGLNSFWSFDKILPKLGIQRASQADVGEIVRLRPPPAFEL